MRPRLTKPPVREGQGEEKDTDLWPLLYPAGLTREWQWALGTGVFAVNGMVYGVLLIPFGYIPRSLLRTIFLARYPAACCGVVHSKVGVFPYSIKGDSHGIHSKL